ncbi:hypothetical protein [Streptomyces sp. S.PNR 29]|uniref:hypothetical protein n=1 Tax=Streptomyces sp. S.PNR 29 TaxID=2973805 RepID=UPI0025B0408C|nr:hypothetical protein [Streptomyces sp. S.PNR 29]MDN0197057.1 hypothetical protein [Streptomyces sp. S.PNR 29]
MRLCTAVSLSLAAAAALLVGPGPAHAGPPARAACAGSDSRAFPVSTRIHGGPGTYEAGGGYGVWYLELTNTTDRACTGIHPVVVLVDDQRALEPSQPRLEFYDGARPHPVRFEETDQDELIGVFAGGTDDDRTDGFPGFSVGPGRTLTVKVRLAVTSDAVANEVTAVAAVVQRHDDDGDWVGQSNDYRFRIESDREPAPEPQPDVSTPASAPPPASAWASASASPRPYASTSTRTPTARTTPAPTPTPAPTSPSSTAPEAPLPLADELAGTGRGAVGILLLAAALVLAGTSALRLARRRR